MSSRPEAGRELLARLGRLPELARAAAALGPRARGCWLVGGLPRDCALGRAPGELLDVDLAAPDAAAERASLLARGLGGTAFVLDEAAQVHRVAVPARGPDRALQIDVARIQGASMAEDLGRRDFTVNALAAAFPLARDAELLDPFGGLRDIARRILRPVSEGAMREDPLRALRAFRLAATLGLRLAPESLKAVRGARGLVGRCAGERVRAELLALLSAPGAPWLERMDEAGLLTAVFPEIEPSRRCAQVYYGEGGVLRHSLDAVARLDLLLESLERVYPDLAPQILSHLAGSLGGMARHCALLRLAVLLHDVSKPECARRVGGRLRFFGHDARGARRAEEILRRLRFSGEEIAMVRAAVLHHLRPGNLAAGGLVTDRAAFRFFRDLGPHAVDLLLVCWADHASYLKPAVLKRLLPRVGREPVAARGGAGPKTLFHLQVVSKLLSHRFRHPELVRPPKLLDGHAVMKALRIPPGPAVGKLLACLQEAQAAGKVKTRAEALAFLRALKPKRYNTGA